jgi:hypothetical protein
VNLEVRSSEVSWKLCLQMPREPTRQTPLLLSCRWYQDLPYYWAWNQAYYLPHDLNQNLHQD